MLSFRSRWRATWPLLAGSLLLGGCVVDLGSLAPEEVQPVYAWHERSPLAKHRVMEDLLYVPGGATPVGGRPTGADPGKR